MVTLLFIGDIIGKPGRKVVRKLTERLVVEHQVDLVIANGENAAGGFGLTSSSAEEIYGSAIDVITSGNHIWDKKEIYPALDDDPRILRPANYPEGLPGRGWGIFTTPGGVKVAVISLEGRVFMNNLDCPFRAADRILEEIGSSADVIFVDIHAEATSEKTAIAHYLDGRVSAVIGTHTHVQTADERVFPQGTAYLTDVGMTGGQAGVIGMAAEGVLERFLTQTPSRFEVEKKDVIYSAVLVSVDEKTGKAISIERIQQRAA